MSSSRFDSWIVLATIVAACSIIGNAAHGLSFARNFPLEGVGVMRIIASVLGQTSLALAMLCIVFLGRGAVTSTDLSSHEADPDWPDDDHDQADEASVVTDDVDRSELFESFPDLRS